MLDLDRKVNDLKLLISETQIQEKSKELAHKLDSMFNPDEKLYLICVLKGSIMFYSELVKHLKHDIQMEFIRLSSYGNNFKSSENIKTLDLNLPDLTNQNIVIVEDIIDTGITAKFLIEMFKTNYKPKKLVFLPMLNKKTARKTDIEPDLFGFEIDDKFVVGYGLDYKGFFRNLPYIAYFS